LNLEEALPPRGPCDPRWDYGIGVAGAKGDIALWLEVHPASSPGHIHEVRRKFDWLSRWLTEEAPALKRVSPRFVWLVTGRVGFQANSPQRKIVAQLGLLLRPRQLDLDLLE
jgi:hypothetical protein